jgi:hypothetical protein
MLKNREIGTKRYGNKPKSLTFVSRNCADIWQRRCEIVAVERQVNEKE